MRSSAALTETCPSGTVRNTPFFETGTRNTPPQPEGTKLPRRLRAKSQAPQPAKRGGPPRFLSTSIRMWQGIPVLRRCHQGRRDNQWYIRKQGKSLRHSLMKDYRSLPLAIFFDLVSFTYTGLVQTKIFKRPVMRRQLTGYSAHKNLRKLQLFFLLIINIHLILLLS